MAQWDRARIGRPLHQLLLPPSSAAVVARNIYYHIPKLLLPLIFLFIFDYLSYSKKLKFYHRFYYDLFY
jgi:hypothetical protein